MRSGWHDTFTWLRSDVFLTTFYTVMGMEGAVSVYEITLIRTMKYILPYLYTFCIVLFEMVWQTLASFFSFSNSIFIYI